MRRVSYILLAIVALVVLGLLSSIVNHGFDELAAAEEERAHLEERTIELSESISEIEATLAASSPCLTSRREPSPTSSH